MKTALVCIGLLALLVFALGLAVSLTRGKTKTNIGYPDDPKNMLHKLCRAHANQAEYVPIFCILMFLIAAPGEPARWLLWTMVLATFFRYLHAFGMVAMPTLARPNAARFLGALGTYVTGFVLTVALLISV